MGGEQGLDRFRGKAQTGHQTVQGLAGERLTSSLIATDESLTAIPAWLAAR